MGIFDEEGERREGRKQEREERKTVNLRTWSVGRCSEGWKTGKEGFAIDYIEAKNYFVLYIMQNGTADESAKERELAEYGKDRPIETRLTFLLDACFFCFKFGALEWGIAPFSHSDKIAPSTLPDCDNGIVAYAAIIDTSKGRLDYVRSFLISREISQAWKDWLSKPNPASGDADPQQRIREAMEFYAVEDFVNNACAISRYE
jgi:hypothetical protein